MLHKLLQKQKDAIQIFFSEVSLEPYAEMVTRILSTTGSLFFTGIGKSGFIAHKIAATFASLGFKAFYLSAVDAVHGDLGALSMQDMLFVLSKTGETKELLTLVAHSHRKGIGTVAITCSKYNQLASLCQYHLFAPCHHELCHYGLAPTVSSTVLLMAGDLLAIGCMEQKQIDPSVFATNHPGGVIGKKASLTVQELMLNLPDVPQCDGEQSLAEVLSVFTHKRCGCILIVTEQGGLQGIFTDGDLRRALQRERDPLTMPMRLLMNSSPRTITPEASLAECLMIMEDRERPITVLPVVDSEHHHLVGLIKMHDIIQVGLTQPVG